MTSNSYKTVLAIAGLDPIGGAGLLADIRTCQRVGVYGMAVATAITAQNTYEVRRVKEVSEQMLREQLCAVLDDKTPDAVKIGMLPTAKSVEIVADAIKNYGLKNVVADPVMISSVGAPLLDDIDAGIKARLELLFPLCTIVTPNIPEACALRIAEMRTPYARLIKGGHGTNPLISEDILISADGRRELFSSQRVTCRNTHGTGCVLSSAIASYLALGLELNDAVAQAKKLLTSALQRGQNISFGHGNGPVWV